MGLKLPAELAFTAEEFYECYGKSGSVDENVAMLNALLAEKIQRCGVRVWKEHNDRLLDAWLTKGPTPNMNYTHTGIVVCIEEIEKGDGA